MRFIPLWLRRTIGSVGLPLGIGVLVVLIGWYFFTPTRLRVAIEAGDTAESGLVAAFAESLSQSRKDVRLRVVRLGDLRETARALEENKVDLAVVRADVLQPGNGLTAAILREEALLIVAPGTKKIESFDKLADKRIGITARHEADSALLALVLEHYKSSAPNVTVVPVKPEEADSPGLASRIDAFAFVATPRSDEAMRMVHTAAKIFGEDLAAVPLEGLEPLVNRNPAIKEAAIPPGTFGLRPKLPDEEIKTAAITYRLVASDDLDRITVSKVLQYLFEMRQRIARSSVAANQMRAPDNDAAIGAALPNHRGAVDYFNREQRSFMDKYGDWLWLALFTAGGFTSVIAGLRQRLAQKRQEVIDHVLDRLILVLSEAREASSIRALDELASELDHLVVHAVRNARRRMTSAHIMTSLVIAFEAARAAISDRRREIETGGARLVPDNPQSGTTAALADAAAT